MILAKNFGFRISV